MGELLLVIPYTVDPFGRDSLAHVSLPSIHPSICSSLGMRVNPDKSSIVSTRRGNETTDVLLFLLFGDKELGVSLKRGGVRVILWGSGG